MYQIVFGCVLLSGGLTGLLALRATGTSSPFVVIGAVLIGWGIMKEMRSGERDPHERPER